MEVKNIALSAVQLSLSATAGVVVVPSVVALSAVSIIAYVAKKTEEVGGTALSEFYFGMAGLNAKLESMKTKQADIVESPIGDDAVAVN